MIRLVLTAVFLVIVGVCDRACTDRALPGREVYGVVVVDSVYADCKRTYTVEFSDEHSDSNSYYYWVGMYSFPESGSERRLLSASAGISLQPPFSGQRMTVELAIQQSPAEGEGMWAAAIRCSSTSEVGVDSKGVRAPGGTFAAPGWPAECCPFSIALMASGQPVDSGGSVLIDTSSVLPALAASIAGGLSTDSAVEWSLIVNFDRPNRNDRDTVPQFTTKRLTRSATWYINNDFSGRIRGGDAILRCFSKETGCTKSLRFCIRSVNPEEYTIENYIYGKTPFHWFSKYVCMQESDKPHQGRYYAQFNVDNNDMDPSCPIVEPRGISGTPNRSSDTIGWGMYQLTLIGYGNNSHWPEPQTLWSWKANVDTAVWWLNEIAVVEAWPFMFNQRGQATGEHPDWGLFSVPDDTVGNVIFSEEHHNRAYPDTNTIENAVTLKRYNGADNGHYCYYNLTSHTWDWHRTRSDGRNYVAEVCSRVPPKP